MNLILPLLLYLSAGLINGSFAVPTKHVKNWGFENTWLQHACWSLLILPWLFALLFTPQIIAVYHIASLKLIIITVLGGFLFGVGQVASALAIHLIGIGLAFVICIGISTGLGFLLPLLIQHPDKILTPFGYITLTGTILAILGFTLSTYAGKLRNQYQCGLEKKPGRSASTYLLGISLAFVGGVFSAGQNLCFALTSNLQIAAINLGATKFGAAIIIWPVFLAFSSIPYVTYMSYLFIKNKSFSCYYKNQHKRNYLLTLMMGLCWYGSLVLYSKASQLSGVMGPIFGWPMFMVIVILSSNYWGYIYKEWSSCSKKSLLYLFTGLSLLIVSMAVLGLSSYFST